jgi:hydroxymethylpyrimidine/phosphomethylpyrimidine kinase
VAVAEAKEFITQAIAESHRWGSGKKKIAALNQVQVHRN